MLTHRQITTTTTNHNPLTGVHQPLLHGHASEHAQTHSASVCGHRSIKTGLVIRNAESHLRVYAYKVFGLQVMKIGQVIRDEFNGGKDLSGIGGVETGRDAAEFLLLGANSVQVSGPIIPGDMNCGAHGLSSCEHKPASMQMDLCHVSISLQACRWTCVM